MHGSGLLVKKVVNSLGSLVKKDMNGSDPLVKKYMYFLGPLVNPKLHACANLHKRLDKHSRQDHFHESQIETLAIPASLTSAKHRCKNIFFLFYICQMIIYKL